MLLIKVRHSNMCPVFPIAPMAAPRFRVSTDMEFRNHIVAKEMPDSLATMNKISSKHPVLRHSRQQNGLFVDDNALG